MWQALALLIPSMVAARLCLFGHLPQTHMTATMQFGSRIYNKVESTGGMGNTCP